MFGGLLKSTSRLALVAAAATVVGGVSAQAADLGGNCCADLEERVAELEATTARKGNRKVSLTVSGQINKHIVWHDSEDPAARRADTFSIQDNDSASQSRFRFVGSAKIDADRTAGYVLEIGVSENAGVEFSATGSNANLNRIRQNHVFIRSASLGQLTVGQQSQTTDGLADISLANIRQMNQGGNVDSSRLLAGASTGTFANNTFNNLQGARIQAVRYDSPTFAGFTLSASWGHGAAVTSSVDDETSQWDVALRYVGEFNGIRLAGGIGYREVQLTGTAAPGDLDKEKVLLGSGSIMHTPTGLFVSGGAGQRDRGDNSVGDDYTVWHVEAGIEKNWFGIGNTTLFGEFSNHSFDRQGTNGTSAGTFFDGSFWGVGFVQQIAAAASDIYVGYRKYDVDNLGDAQVFQAGMIVRF